MVWPRRSVLGAWLVRSAAVMPLTLLPVAVQAQALVGAPLPVPGGGASPPPMASAPPSSEIPSVEVLVPLPPRRPESLGGSKPSPSESVSTTTGEACLAALRETRAQFETVETPKNGSAACRIETPVRLTALALADATGRVLPLADKPIVDCRLALAFDAWMTEIAPNLVASRGASLSSVTTGPGWECRTRNRQPGAPLSNHANGLALDVNTFSFANKARLSVSGNAGDPTFRSLRAAACSHFTTVLGPGSDGFHEGHLHVDVLSRHPGRFGRFCH